MTAAAKGSSAPAPDPAILRAAIHAIGDGVTLTNSDGRIVYSNPAADRILGVPATDAPPDEWFEHYGTFLPDGETPFPSDEYPLVLAVNGQSTDNVEMVVRNAAVPEGAVISVTGRPLRNSHGDIIGAAVVFRDVTRLRMTEAQKRELTGFLVHDMKNPLMSIISNCDIVLGSNSLEEIDREALVDLHSSAERLRKMVVNLLDIQAAEDGRLEPQSEPLEPMGVLEQVARAAKRNAPDVTLHVREAGEEPLPQMLADRELLRRIIANLVDNCLKYGPSDGRVWLKAAAPTEDTVLLTISDEGPGVPPELREKIFEPYARVERNNGRRDPTSRGLGLRFCQVAVEAHGGRIWVEDNDPVGARFCVELPLAVDGP